MGISMASPKGMKPRTLLAVALVMFAFASGRSSADPPDPDSEDGKLMAPYVGAIRALRQRNGALCCSESDCRPARYKVNDAGNYEVFVRKLTKDGSGWEDGPDAWVEVPAERVTPPNLRPPVPFGLACWRARKSFGSGGFTCFTPGTGT
jgi:hypothetical protein